MKSMFGFHRVPPHLVNQANIDPGSIQAGVEQREPLVLRLTCSSGVVRASSSILLATCAVEIQIFSRHQVTRRRRRSARSSAPSC